MAVQWFERDHTWWYERVVVDSWYLGVVVVRVVDYNQGVGFCGKREEQGFRESHFHPPPPCLW
eukprot:767111-Hanusia_phi.AAC.4